MSVLKLYSHLNSMPHLKAIIVHILIGLTDSTFSTYVYKYVNMYVLLLRGPYKRLVYVLNMSSSLNKDIIIIIIIIIIFIVIIIISNLRCFPCY